MALSPPTTPTPPLPPAGSNSSNLCRSCRLRHTSQLVQAGRCCSQNHHDPSGSDFQPPPPPPPPPPPRLRDPVDDEATPIPLVVARSRSPSDARRANATIFPSCLRRQRKRLPTHDWICGKASRSGATTKTIGRGARAVMTIAKTRSNASVWARGVSDSLPGSTAKKSPSCSLRTGTKMSVSSCVYCAQSPECYVFSAEGPNSGLLGWKDRYGVRLPFRAEWISEGR